MYIFVLGISGFIILLAMLKTHRFIKTFMFSAVQGLVALFSVNLIGDVLKFHIPFNWFSTVVSVVGSLPGVIFLVVSDIFTKI